MARSMIHGGFWSLMATEFTACTRPTPVFLPRATGGYEGPNASGSRFWTQTIVGSPAISNGWQTLLRARGARLLSTLLMSKYQGLRVDRRIGVLAGSK